jgi:acetyl esterase
VRPRGVVLPLVLHFHGGAFVSGDLDSGAQMAQLLAEAGAIVASLAYPLAPAHRFPDAVEAGYAALEVALQAAHPLAGRARRCTWPATRRAATWPPRWP